MPAVTIEDIKEAISIIEILERIATALNAKLEISLIPMEEVIKEFKEDSPHLHKYPGDCSRQDLIRHEENLRQILSRATKPTKAQEK